MSRLKAPPAEEKSPTERTVIMSPGGAEREVPLIARRLRSADIRTFVEHLLRHLPENGRDGPYFLQEAAGSQDFEPDRIAARRSRRWGRPAEELGWARAWGAITPEGLVVGHAELTGSRTSTATHRAQLSLGIERAWRRRGLGSALLSRALGWAFRKPRIRWVDVSVFAQNPPALRLLQKSGFVVAGNRPDRVRVDGVRLDEVLLTVDLDRWR